MRTSEYQAEVQDNSRLNVYSGVLPGVAQVLKPAFSPPAPPQQWAKLE